jgi:hypothetical protein
MILPILFAIAAIVGFAGLALALWTIKLSVQRMNERLADKVELSVLPIAPLASGGLLDLRERLIGEIAHCFTVPAHILRPNPAPIHFDTWMRERTERAHREFMERTSRRLMCDWSTEDIDAYMAGSMG